MSASGWLCRCAVYPQFVGNDPELFDDDAFVKLVPWNAKEPQKGAALSVTTEYVCKGVAGAHTYGFEMAEAANVARRKRLGDGEVLSEPRLYLGFYRFRREVVNALRGKIFTARVRWKPENGLSEHMQLELVPRKQVDASKNECKREIRHARGVLSVRFFGPEFAPVSAADKEYQEMLPIRKMA